MTSRPGDETQRRHGHPHRYDFSSARASLLRDRSRLAGGWPSTAGGCAGSGDPFGSRRVDLLLLALTVVILLLGAALALDNVVYRASPWSTYPNPLHGCGRDLQPAGPS